MNTIHFKIIQPRGFESVPFWVRFKWNEYTRLKVLLPVIKKINQSQREDVVTQALRVITENMNSDDRVHVINAVHEINPDERDEVVTLADPLLKGMRDGDQRALVIYAIRKINVKVRKEVIEQVYRLKLNDMFTGEEAGEVTMRIITDLASMCSLDRQSLIDRLLRKRENYIISTDNQLRNIAAEIHWGLREVRNVDAVRGRQERIYPFHLNLTQKGTDSKPRG